ILFVDLDGTLLATDLLWESLFLFIKQKPGSSWMIPFWMLGGRAQLKTRIAEQINPEARDLPYNREILEIIRAKKAEGVRMVLATASAQEWATEVSSHLALFDDVLATVPGNNLKGRAKLAAIQSYCTRNGFHRFGYMGDSGADIPIWKEAE